MEYEEEHEEQEEEIGDPNFDSGRHKKSGVGYRYRECQKNHAVGICGHAVDGCGEFIAAGEDGTLDGLRCAACNCHRNFHRKEVEGEVIRRPQLPQLAYHHPPPPPGYYPAVTPPPLQQRPPALPFREDDRGSNPSSSGGGGSGSSKKRFRTKFTAEQKEKMLILAEKVGWRLQKQDEAEVEQFCNETGLKRHVLKVWMHNNKHTLGKKP